MQYKEIIERIYKELQDYTGHGKVADYIPALSKVIPDNYGISVATLDGENFSIGDVETRFTIQSIFIKMLLERLQLALVCPLFWCSIASSTYLN